MGVPISVDKVSAFWHRVPPLQCIGIHVVVYNATLFTSELLPDTGSLIST